MTVAQVTGSRQDSIMAVLTMHESSWHWLSLHSARLAVQEYGEDAGTVAGMILENLEGSREPWTRIMAAVGVAAYERSGFPVARLVDMASGRHRVSPDANRNYGFRLAALRALGARPRVELTAYWTQLIPDRLPEVRRAAVAGLACAQGVPALEAVARLAGSDADSRTRTVAEFYVREIADRGDSARVCLYGTWTRSQAASGEVPVDSALTKRAEQYFGFRRR
jgi:hypothetical protein